MQTQKRVRVLLACGNPALRGALLAALSGDPGLDVSPLAGLFPKNAGPLSGAPADVALVCLIAENGPGCLAPFTQAGLPVVCAGAPGMEQEARAAGAADFIALPDGNDETGFGFFIRELSVLLKVAPGAHLAGPSVQHAAQGATVIAIGASAGGTDAISAMLKTLPPDMPGIVMVQHMPAGFTGLFAQRLDGESRLTVREARDGDRVRPGLVLLAPGGLQTSLLRTPDGFAVRCRPGEKVSGHCPSVDVLFHSTASAAGPNSAGIILTGMGSDGAAGLLAMRRAGAFTIGQDEASSVVYGMPMEAQRLGAVTVQADCAGIAALLTKRYAGQ